MEEKKNINSNYGILVILMFAIICTLADYIIIDRKLREDNVNNNDNTNIIIDSKKNVTYDKDNSKSLTYKDVAGIYKVDFDFEMVYYDESKEIENAKYNLFLYTDGTFYYNYPDHVNHGMLGNYTIDDDHITLNGLFEHGGDIGLTLNFSSKELKIDGSKNLIETAPLVKPVNSESSSVILVKDNSFTDSDNKTSRVKEMYKVGILRNGNE